MTAAATSKQIGFIHGLAAKAGLDEDLRRDFLERMTGKRSCKDITFQQADTVIRELQSRNGRAVKGLDTPFGRKLRALWIAGYQLGLVRDRGDRAMLAFVERQTGVSHIRFLAEPGDGTAAVEGLKRWLARDGGVAWPTRHANALESKAAVLAAQWRKLIALGIIVPGAPIDHPRLRALSATDAAGWDTLTVSSDYDSIQRELGQLIRRAQGKEARRG